MEGALVYLQYGPSQPEFLDLAAARPRDLSGEPFTAPMPDEKGSAFREKYRAEYPGTMGMVYTGGGYDSVYILADAWKAAGDPANFDAVGEALKNINHRGVNGHYSFSADTQSGVSYPNMTGDPEAGQGASVLSGSGTASTGSLRRILSARRPSPKRPGCRFRNTCDERT